jgi:AMP-polyphosphate phosphotransferase
MVEFADYERRLVEMQETLQRVQQAYRGTAHRAIIVLEGWDTAGKGGWALDPRSCKVHAIAAPTAREELDAFLRRFPVIPRLTVPPQSPRIGERPGRHALHSGPR